MTNAREHRPQHIVRRARIITAAFAAAALSGLAAPQVGSATDDAGVASTADLVSTAERTGISDPLAFLMSEHFPDLSAYPEFAIAMGGVDRCLFISPLPCD